MNRSLCTLFALSIITFGCGDKTEDDTGEPQYSSGGTTTGGTTTGGATTGGTETGGAETGGEETGGEETGGEETGGEETGGTETGGEETGSEETGGEETGSEETGGEGTGEGTGEATGAGSSGGDPEPVWGGTLDGELAYFSERTDPESGEVTTSCDFDSKLSSRSFVGACDGCEFAFKIDAELTEDRSADDCNPVMQLSFSEDMAPLINWVMAYAPEWAMEGITGTNVLLTGMSIDFSALEGFTGYGYSLWGSPDPGPGKSYGDEYSVPYDDYYGYYYGGPGGTSFTEWYPIAFDIDSIPSGILEADDATGTVTFDATSGELNWTSTVRTFESSDRYIDYSCSWSDAHEMPLHEDDEDDEDAATDDSFEWYGDRPVDGPALSVTEDGSLTCKMESWGEEEWPGGDISTSGDGEGASGDVVVSLDEEESSSSEDGEPTADVPDYEEWWSSPGMDVWTVNLEADVSTLITVDTLDAETSFDPWFYISDADECIVAEGYNNFDCTENAVRDDACPGVEFIPETAGLHYILVYADECMGDSATYQIGIDGPASPDLTLLGDDVDRYIETEFQHTVTGSATVDGDYGPPEPTDGEPDEPPPVGTTLAEPAGE